MKKVFLALLILSVSIFTTGCMKNYKTVSEYSEAMNKVKTELGDYTIDAVILRDGREKYIKSYTGTNNKWKALISEDGGKSYNTGILYDGAEVLSYDIISKMAIPLPFADTFSAKKMGDNNIAKSIMKMINPVGILFDWSFMEFGGEIDKDWKFGKIAKKNNFKCRMIHLTYDNNQQVCVNDKYGIAVYANFFDKRKNQAVTINVKSIENVKLSDSAFRLPEGIKKQSLEDLLGDLVKSMKQMRN